MSESLNFTPMEKTFEQAHPYALVDRATGIVERRFSQLRAAVDSAEWVARNEHRSLEVVTGGEVIGRYGPLYVTGKPASTDP